MRGLLANLELDVRSGRDIPLGGDDPQASLSITEGAVPEVVSVMTFGKLIDFLARAFIHWKIYLLTAIGAKSHSGRWDILKCSAMSAMMVLIKP